MARTPADIDARSNELDFYLEVKSTVKDYIQMEDNFKGQVESMMKFIDSNPIRFRAGFFFIFHSDPDHIKPQDLVYFMFVQHVNYLVQLVRNPKFDTKSSSKGGLCQSRLKKLFFFNGNVKIPFGADGASFNIIKINLLPNRVGNAIADLSPLIHTFPYRPFLQDHVEPISADVVTKTFIPKRERTLDSMLPD